MCDVSPLGDIPHTDGTIFTVGYNEFVLGMEEDA